MPGTRLSTMRIALSFIPAVALGLALAAGAEDAPAAGPASSTSARADAPAPAPPVIAVADFSGPNPDVGRFLADTLLTDLAQSDKLQFVERTEIRKALSELKLEATGLVDTQQVRKLGALLRADRLLVGSYLEHDGQTILNARLLDVQTGRLSPGSAANVTGDSGALLPLVHRLAHLLHWRLTGSDLVLGGEPTHSRPTGSSGYRVQDVPAGVSADPAPSAPTAPPANQNAPQASDGYRVQEATQTGDPPTYAAPPPRADIAPSPPIYYNAPAVILPSAPIYYNAPSVIIAPTGYGYRVATRAPVFIRRSRPLNLYPGFRPARFAYRTGFRAGRR